MSAELRVPKRKVAVELLLVDGSRRAVHVFLAERSPKHAGHERLSELLGGADDFFPVEEDGSVSFVRVDAVVEARADRDAEDAGAEDAIVPTEHAVRVEMHGARMIDGRISFVMPPERSRLQDYLRAAPRFVPLLAPDASVVVLLNRAHIVRIASR